MVTWAKPVPGEAFAGLSFGPVRVETNVIGPARTLGAGSKRAASNKRNRGARFIVEVLSFKRTHNRAYGSATTRNCAAH